MKAKPAVFASELFKMEKLCAQMNYSMQQHGSAFLLGWQGCAPPKKTQEELKSLYESGEILKLLWVFFLILYSKPLR